MKLSEFQERFQASVLTDGEPEDAPIIGSIEDSHRSDRATLFSVYFDAYRLRLAEFISNDFPVIRQYIGDEAFGGLVQDYISSGPSQQRNARWYASRLPDFMREQPQWRRDPNACDLALFERALTDAFDAADSPVLAIEALSVVNADDWPQLVFAFHPSVTILNVAQGTAQLYDALAEGKEPDAIREGEETVLVWRCDDQSVYRNLDEDERLALIEATQGKNFGEVCTLLAFQKVDENVTPRVAGFLSQWFADGLVTRISISQ